MNQTDLGFRLKQLREQRNISQEEMAESLIISQSKLSKIENGRIKKVDFILMNRICIFFSLTIPDFLNMIN